MEIKVINQRFEIAAIEWTDENGNLLKGIAPTSIISGDGKYIDDDRMSLVIPDCMDWVFCLEGTIRPVTALDIARELYKRRLWTVKDLYANAQAVDAAIKSAIGIDVSTVIKAAESCERGGSNG